jgi:alcohol oxidase
VAIHRLCYIFADHNFADFPQFENFQNPDPEIDPSIHGYGGEMSISQGSNVQEGFQQDFFQACETLGIGRVADVADFKISNAVGVSRPK